MTDIREKMLDFYAERARYEAISPWPTKKVARQKRWLVFEVVERCYECGRATYRLQWPWRTTYDDVPQMYINSIETAGWGFEKP